MNYIEEGKVYQYITNTLGNDYTKVIAEEKSEEVFFHLSDLRAGILGWYDFLAGSSVLEVGSSFGGLTGTLCSRCRKVTAVVESKMQVEGLRNRYPKISNLRIVKGWEAVARCGETFDYVISVGHMETVGQGRNEAELYAEYLKTCINLLKPDGILMIAVDNRYGLRYLCGDCSSYARLPFAEVGQNLSGGRFFAKGEIESLLQEAGYQQWQFYYPLPDWRYPQVIYTDGHLPTVDIFERLVPYHRKPKNMLLDERSMYRNVLASGGFPFLANSFLVECKRSGVKTKQAEYIALSSDRGRDKAFATVLYADGRVKKQPLFAEGESHAHLLFLHLNELNARGLSVVPCDFRGGALLMPYVSKPTLSLYLAQIVRKKPSEALCCWDILWQAILSSSSYVSVEQNRLTSLEVVDMGPILDRAFLELMPMNCFYEEGKLTFFDQEYVEDKYPAKYILFRGLYFFYILNPEAEKYLPLEQLKKRYGLVECWTVFEAEELRFQRRVRRHDYYRRLYEHAIALEDMQQRKNLIALGRSLGDRKKELIFFLDHIRLNDFVIFGAGGLFCDYMGKYGLKYPPKFVVDNDEAKWGHKIAGVKVCSPDVLRSKNCVLICSQAFKEISEQLDELGVEIYRIYC